MIQSQSKLKIADNTGVKFVKVISIRGRQKGGGYQRFGGVGDIVSASVIKALPNSTISEHEKVHVVIVRTKKECRRKDGSYLRFDDNAGVIIDLDNRAPIGTRVLGPVARELKVKGFTKIISLAPEVL
ncbi:50S ribosomal protein L14 [Candidatus Dojkabacteria bacterium]|nr:50S ribosomal protein L14 [Candidatus Dojkabacteria bacterium]